MTDIEKLKLVYEYHRSGYEPYPTFEEWINKEEIKNTSKEDFDREYEFALKAKERTDIYHKMIQDNSYTLINNNITEEEIEHELSTTICKCNMDGEIERLLFVIETLKAFNIYYPDIKINNIKTLGGGFYEDGIIFGYNINVDNNDTYRIELTDFNEEELGYESLSYRTNTYKQLMEIELETLNKFKGFYNSETIEQSIKKLEEMIHTQKMHI